MTSYAHTKDDEVINLGVAAHITAAAPGGPRYDSSLSADQRKSASNAIWLCQTCAKLIDSDELKYTVEVLKSWKTQAEQTQRTRVKDATSAGGDLVKSEHETWVHERLSPFFSGKLVEQEPISAIIESVVSLADLANWASWTSWVLCVDPHWERDGLRKVLELRKRVVSSIWPDGYGELKRATDTLSLLLFFATKVLRANADLDEREGSYRARKFYKLLPKNPDYDIDLDRYNEWADACHDAIREATKAANWFAEVVRRDVEPRFFAKTGWFLIDEYDAPPQFTQEEKKTYPTGLEMPANPLKTH